MLRSLFRLFTIYYVCCKYRLDLVVPQSIKNKRFKLIFLPARLFNANHLNNGERIHLTLQHLGPVFIKFGQLLSTRNDMFTDEVIAELAKLQDRVPPFSNEEAHAIIAENIGKNIEDCFASIDKEPLASASIAQVYAAKLLDNTDVVIKIKRPNIEKVIAQDIRLMRLLATIAENQSVEAKRFHPRQIVDDYERVIEGELNLRQEAANTSQLKNNHSSEHLQQMIYVPSIYWEFCFDNMLVMERVFGIPVSDIETMKKNKVNLKLLSDRGVEIFFTQVFEHNFFHADMHPGNVFVDISDPENPRYIALDSAIIGSLSENDLYYIAHNLLAALNRDYFEVARLHHEAGWVPKDTDLTAFATVIRSTLEPIFDKPLSEISTGTLLLYLLQTARRFGMEVQPSLILLQKTIVHVEGLGQKLYPELDLWETAQPFLARWVKERYSPISLVQQLETQLPRLLTKAPMLLSKLAEHGTNEQQRLLSRVEKLEVEANSGKKTRFIALTAIIVLALSHFYN